MAFQESLLQRNIFFIMHVTFNCVLFSDFTENTLSNFVAINVRVLRLNCQFRCLVPGKKLPQEDYRMYFVVTST